MSGLPLTELVGVGLPPQLESQEPLGFIDGIMLIVVIAFVFWLSVRSVAWIETKVELWQLLRELRRELGRDRRP